MPPESLFERVARQTLKSVVEDQELMFEILRKILENYDGNNDSQTSSMAYERIYSPMFIQSFFNSPHFNINLLFKSEGIVLTDIQLKQKPMTFFTKTQKDIVEKFLKTIQVNKPIIMHDWISMHHYIYYVYRNFVTTEPTQEKDDIPDKFYKKMRNLFKGLLVHDPSQLYVRLFATLRDFVMAAKRCFEKITDAKLDSLWYLNSFLTYYNALCGAAQRLTTTVIEFDEILDCYNFNWLRFNKILFYTYFFKSIQTRLDTIQQLLKSRDINNAPICDSYCLFLEDMNQTNSAWITHKLRTDALSKDLNNEKIANDMKLFNSEKKFLNVNYWIPRTPDFMDDCEINCSSFISYLVNWLGTVKNVTPTLIDLRGQCQCEKCILEEFLLQIPETQISERFIKCDSCPNICLLKSFALHVMECHVKNRTKTDICSTYLEDEEEEDDIPVRNYFPEASTIFFRKTMTSEYKNPEPLMRIGSEAPIFQDTLFRLTSEPNCFKGYVKTKHSEPVLSIDDLIKKKYEAIGNKKTDDKFLNKGNFAEIREKARMFCNKGEPLSAHMTNKITMNSSNRPDKKSLQKVADEVDAKVLAAMRHSNNHHKTICHINNPEKGNNICNRHQCKNVEENLTEKKNPCQDTCEHFKESRKCDCTYCEVFGTSVSASHYHKINETRNRLRTRLNQRKENCNETSKTAVNKTNSLPYPTVTKSNSTSSLPMNKARTADIGQPINIAALTERVPNLPNMMRQSEKTVVPKSSNAVVTNKIEPVTFKRSISSLSTCSLNSLCKDNSDSRDINDLLKFIEGDKNLDKLALAEKKAAKKARQKMKKEEERKKIEEEEKRKEEQRIREKKIKEQEQLRAENLAKQLAEKIRKNKKNSVDIKMPYHKQGDLKCKKNKNSKNNTDDDGKHSIEETIPAMVTIKRIVENNNSPPTVTITLKGSTPDQDKLLYTLVNGHTKELNENGKINNKKNKNLLEVKNSNKYESSENNDSKKSKKKKKKANNNNNGEINNSGQTKEVKVTLSVDQICTKVGNSKKENKSENKNNINSRNTQKTNDKIKTNKDLSVNIPMLRLPPGITITKVDGPINKNCKLLVNDTINQNTNVPVSKSGVIVVDTEKLIQHNTTTSTTTTTVEQPKTNSKKNKKKKNRKNENTQDTGNNNNKKNSSTSSMVTLKNPIFQTLQTTLASKAINEKLITEVPNVMSCNQHASIIKNDNGMVTIRSPRLQHSLTNGAVMTNLLSELKPVIGPDVSSPYLQTCHSNFNDNNRVSPFNAQEILSGLPGIEITKVEKRKDDNEIKKSCQTADVSIIPTTNGADKFNFDKDDWPYESVFTPKDILEDDLDAEERELEAFKRFCQQSVPPKRKEKVAHLNVKDIVLKKKNDFVVN